jgi:hypothetical protein
MAFEAKLNTCALFRNDRNDKSDLTGRIEIACPQCGAHSGFWVNGWRKVSQAGTKYLYIALKPRSETAAVNDEHQPH